MHLGVVTTGFDFEFFVLGSFGLGCGDETVFQHAVNDVKLAHPGTLGVGDRVKGRRSLGQARQHGRFGNGDAGQRFVEVRLGGRRKAVGPVTQKNLVHVDLKNLVLGQHVLQLERQQYFVNLSGVGFLG